MASLACGEYDSIIFSGGDGTFNDVCNCVSKNEMRPILGYIPSGTANDISKNLKLSKNFKKALKVIIEGNTIKHDVGMINDMYFMYVCGCGTFTSVSYETSQKWKKIFGRLAYAFDGMKELQAPTVVNAKILLDSGEVVEHNCPLFLVLNSRSIGGIPMNKRGHLNDGKFDVVACKKFWTYIGGIINLVLIGTFKGRDHSAYYDFYRSSEIEINVSDDIIWCVDGERGPKGNVKIKNLPGWLTIYVPKKHNKLFLSNKKFNLLIEKRKKNENNSR